MTMLNYKATACRFETGDKVHGAGMRGEARCQGAKTHAFASET
jgi:hypothetical protein